MAEAFEAQVKYKLARNRIAKEPKMPETGPESGPISYENWRRQHDGVLSSGAYEVPLYSDARFTGSYLQLGPYLLINTIPLERGYGISLPAIVLRVESHLPREEFTPMEATDTRRYHGGGLSDEIAALMSLWLGVRLKAGPTNRRFDTRGDSRGVPIANDITPAPTFMPNPGGPRFPWAIGEYMLDDPGLIATFPSLAPDQANAIVKVARAYQNALWIGEAEPETAWLFLVSAVEVAASAWSQSQENLVEMFQSSYPDIAGYLREECGEDVLARVAASLAQLVGATRKFVRFMMHFVPDPPTARPPQFYQLDWSPENMERALRLIYRHRSQALHGGTPFPAPMCETPPVNIEWAAPAEVPVGLATRTMGGTWVHTETPMLLHVFAYLVRSALMNWWASLVAGPQSAQEAPSS